MDDKEFLAVTPTPRPALSWQPFWLAGMLAIAGGLFAFASARPVLGAVCVALAFVLFVVAAVTYWTGTQRQGERSRDGGDGGTVGSDGGGGGWSNSDGGDWGSGGDGGGGSD